MYSVTLKVSARNTESHGLFISQEVANYVAEGLLGFENCKGVVTEVTVDESKNIEAYLRNLEAQKELIQKEEYINFFNGLSEAQQALIKQFASIHTGGNI